MNQEKLDLHIEESLADRAGEASIVEMDITFSCTRHDSPKIDIIAKRLLEKYQILMDEKIIESIKRRMKNESRKIRFTY